MAAEARQIGGAPESAGVAADGVAPRRDDGGAGVRVDDVDGVVGCASALVRKHGNTAQIGVAASVGYLITQVTHAPVCQQRRQKGLRTARRCAARRGARSACPTPCPLP